MDSLFKNLNNFGVMRLVKLIIVHEKAEKKRRLNESWNAIRIKEILRSRDLGF